MALCNCIVEACSQKQSLARGTSMKQSVLSKETSTCTYIGDQSNGEITRLLERSRAENFVSLPLLEDALRLALTRSLALSWFLSLARR
mmetsp:Transcript_95651/g.169829  ORF Transcript_95651/g.169829 Transcript_95651/m.169829 type:complete len:88 (+) Transcript_95651:3-266(+)